MILDELKHIAQAGESERVEFKRSTGQRTEGMKTVCAMLNGVGGYLFFGVTDNGALVGQQVSAGTLEDITRELRRIDPPCFPDMETIQLENGASIVLLLVNGGGGPYTYDGRSYFRHGPTTSIMPREQYERLLLEQMHANRRWENAPAEKVTLEDIDIDELLRTVAESIRRQRLSDPGTRDPYDLMRGLGLYHDGRLLNAAVVLFGKNERMLPDFPQCTLRMARFRGHDKREFMDNRQETGNAFDLLLRAQRFMRDHLPVAGRIVPNLFERIDDPLYPPAALREALANAFCHRDYSIIGGAVSIAIFDDRLEISSAGQLPFGLTPDDLVRPHRSRPWNPLIAQTFYRRGIIESWGRGTIAMGELTREAGLVAPEFFSEAGEVVVRFQSTAYISPHHVGHHLSPLQQELLSVLDVVGPSSLSTIREKLREETADRTIQENLATLRTHGLTDSVGRGRGARWVLKDIRE